VRATTVGAPEAIASRATIPNGSYSEGITTHPARCSIERSSSSGTNPASVTRSLTPSMSTCVCSSARYEPRPAITQRTSGTRRSRRAIACTSTWKPFSYCTRPQLSTSASRAGAVLTGGAHSPGSTPFGTRCTFSVGSSNPSTTSRTMNFEQQITSRAWYVSHHSTALIAAGMPGGRWPPWRPRSVAWIVATSGTPSSVRAVSPAQATNQSCACTTSGRQSPSRASSDTRWWLAEAILATRSPSGTHGRSMWARTTRTPSTTASSGALGW
jgi:hypothetical protein